MTIPVDSTTRVLRGIKGDFYIVREVVVKTGISESTLRRAIRNNDKEMMPSKVVKNGMSVVYLYTPEDIERIVTSFNQRFNPKDFDGTAQTGRPRKYTDDQRKERSRLHSKANYYKKRAENLKRDKRHKEAREAMRRYKEVRSQLDEQ